MKIPNLRHYALLIITLFVASCGAAGSSPSTPTNIPTAIEFAGADMVVSMGGSLSLTSNADFSGGQVKFTDFATGELDTSGICGSSSIDGTDIEITGPDTWPNLQSECGVCFEYDGACLPVDHSIAASLSSQLGPLWDEAPENQDNIIVDTGPNIGFEIESTVATTFPSVEQSYLVSLRLVNFEKNLGTSSAISEMHICGFRLEYDATNAIYAPTRLVHAWSSDGLVSVGASQYEYLSTSGDFVTQNCSIDVEDDSAGNKIVAVLGVGYLCQYGLGCQGTKRAVLYVNGSGVEVVSVNESQGHTFNVDGIAIDSDGNVHVVYHYDSNIYHKLCSSSSCSAAVTVATGFMDTENGVIMASYEDIVYVAYARDHDGDGYSDVMVKTISGNTVGDETVWSSASATKGSAMSPYVDVYRNQTTLELITTVAYSYETVMDGYVSISPGTEYKFTDVSPLGATTGLGALVVSKGGYIYIGYNLTDADSTVYARYSRGEIVSGETVSEEIVSKEISNGIVVFPQASVLATDAVTEHQGFSFLSRVGMFYYIYQGSAQGGDWAYSPAPVGTVIGQGY